MKYISARLNILSLISKEKAAEEAIKMFSTPRLKKKKLNPPIFESGIKHSLVFNGKKIKGYQWNPEGQKKVLILHGFESSSVNFHRYVEEFLLKGMQVVAFDAPAHGKSEGKTIILPEYVSMIELVQEKFGPFQRFMTHSFGGLALVHFLEKNPHQPTDKIALIAPATETTTAIHQYFTMLNLKEDIKPVFFKVIEQKTGKKAEYFSINRAIQQVQAKVKWYHDKQDYITPVSDIRPSIEKKLPNVEFRISSGLGHNRIYRDEETVRDVINFLSSE